MSETLRAAPAADIQDAFIGWQCRLRQQAMRNDGGRPSQGMMPRVLTDDETVLLEHMITLIVPRYPFESTTFFKHQVRKTHDRREVMEKGLTYLQSTHFQVSTGFRDELTAVFGPNSEAAEQLIAMPSCILEFSQFSQTFRLVCRARALSEDSGIYQATIWHNRLFNPQLPDGAMILGFQPDWDAALMSGPN